MNIIVERSNEIKDSFGWIAQKKLICNEKFLNQTENGKWYFDIKIPNPLRCLVTLHHPQSPAQFNDFASFFLFFFFLYIYIHCTKKKKKKNYNLVTLEINSVKKEKHCY